MNIFILFQESVNITYASTMSFLINIVLINIVAFRYTRSFE